MYKVLAILVMFLVTYIPRALPIAFVRKKIKNRFILSFLFYVPYAVIAGMTFPAVLTSTGNLYLSIIGTSVALILAFLNRKMYFIALVTVVIVYACSFLFF